ncbi:hypothetical protein niasHT_029476 [Heterodera trifolii]|uniref:Bestrophin homolog n=1 Tax=Heterodera trifolii TaxID=157864 RepID=A0ABD2KIA8_9BILA
MTISYTLDVSKSSWGGFFRILSRWRGSVWKAVMGQLIVWTIIYMLISLVYRRLLNTRSQEAWGKLKLFKIGHFEQPSWSHYLNYGLDIVTIPAGLFNARFLRPQPSGQPMAICSERTWLD